MTTKICTKCGIEKPVKEFSLSKNEEDGYNDWCKRCHKEYGKLNYDKPRQYININQKECVDCDKTKPIDEFPLRKDSIDGHRGQCKECQFKYKHEYYLINIDHKKEINKRYHENNREEANKQNKKIW